MSEPLTEADLDHMSNQPCIECDCAQAAAEIRQLRRELAACQPTDRQGYVGTFQELIDAYGLACAAIGKYEDDATVPLDEHIAKLVRELSAWKAAVERFDLGYMPQHRGGICREAERLIQEGDK